MSREEKLYYIYKFNGQEKQIQKLVEEFGELLQVFNKGKDLESMAEEIADVEVLLDQFKEVNDIEKDVERIKEMKIERTMRRINVEINNVK